jgi:uncharacterized protein with PIN domain
MGKFTEDDVSTFSGEKIRLIKVKCKCGHTISFMKNHFAICSYCGRKVYPTKKSEFKDKLIKELKRNESSNINRKVD